MREYRDEWVDDFTDAPVASPPQRRVKVEHCGCDRCGKSTADKPHLSIYRYGINELCWSCLHEFVWEISEKSDAEECMECGIKGEELREYWDGRVGCKECIGEWAMDEAECVTSCV